LGRLTGKANSNCFLHESRKKNLDDDRRVQRPSTTAGEPPLPLSDLTRTELLSFTSSPPRPARGRRNNAAKAHTQKKARNKVFIMEIPALDTVSILSSRRSSMGTTYLRRMRQGRPEEPGALLQTTGLLPRQLTLVFTEKNPAPPLSHFRAASPPETTSAWPGKHKELLSYCSKERECREEE
jgi:hypothetical protein